ncbi:MAG: hypothetical protein J5U19_10990 [Candidatus Methanoperedens sp.]|nr:hypothetical protein [Candidatus Methanoperedens sp.]
MPLEVDFSNPKRLYEIRSILDILSDEPIIFGLLGNTLANFDDDNRLLGNVSNILKPGDLLLLELAKTRYINEDSKGMAKREYNQRAFRNFAISSLLQATNMDAHDDWFDIEVDEEEFP